MQPLVCRFPFRFAIHRTYGPRAEQLQIDAARLDNAPTNYHASPSAFSANERDNKADLTPRTPIATGLSKTLASGPTTCKARQDRPNTTRIRFRVELARQGREELHTLPFSFFPANLRIQMDAVFSHLCYFIFNENGYMSRSMTCTVQHWFIFTT